jgi:hypothetical protein
MYSALKRIQSRFRQPLPEAQEGTDLKQYYICSLRGQLHTFPLPGALLNNNINPPAGKGRPVREADNLTAVCEPVV